MGVQFFKDISLYPLLFKGLIVNEGNFFVIFSEAKDISMLLSVQPFTFNTLMFVSGINMNDLLIFVSHAQELGQKLGLST